MANGPWKKIELPAGKGAIIVCAIWQNTVENQGDPFVAYSVTLQRRYRDGEEWKTSESLRPQDLLTAAHALTIAYDAILHERKQQ